MNNVNKHDDNLSHDRTAELLDNHTSGLRSLKSTKKSPKKVILIAIGCMLVLGVLLIVGAYAWYSQQLAAVDPSSDRQVRFTVVEGATNASIAVELEQKGIIRDERAYRIYARLNNVVARTGVYELKLSSDVRQIADELSSGNVTEKTITFLPGATMFDARDVLIKSGYSEDEVDAALLKRYDSPLVNSRGEEKSLEGFIYGDTYNVAIDAPAETALQTAISHMQEYVDVNDLEAGYKKQGLTLYEGIILASIVQKEVTNHDEMRHVAQVLLLRLRTGMRLGSDPTAQYGARISEVKTETIYEAVMHDSSFNTRKNTGLPPTPISNPGAAALKAVANPTDTDDLFFVAGDDGKTYFSKTNAEHERNVRDHCVKLCQL